MRGTYTYMLTCIYTYAMYYLRIYVYTWIYVHTGYTSSIRNLSSNSPCSARVTTVLSPHTATYRHTHTHTHAHTHKCSAQTIRRLALPFAQVRATPPLPHTEKKRRNPPSKPKEKKSNLLCRMHAALVLNPVTEKKKEGGRSGHPSQ